jgi:Flp pilus assembly secretin CpaC
MEWGANHPVNEGIQKEIVSPETEAATRESTGERMLGPGDPLWIRSGKSRIIRFRRPVQRVSVGNPELAGIVVLGPRTIMINAKVPPRLQGQEMQGAPMSGQYRLAPVSNTTLTPPPHYSETTLTVWESGASQPEAHSLFVADFSTGEVLLEVTVAELNRTAMEQHGIDFRRIGSSFATAYFGGGGISPLLGTVVPPQGGAPLFPLSFSGTTPNYVFRIPNDDITAFITLLQTEGLATLLAQPKILAMSGQNAVFQVGGEIPIRIVSGFSADVEFKPFGTLVTFIPHLTDEGDIILTVTPEVSRPDFSNQVEGVPSFVTRRASTSAKLRNGETLVVGGLLENDRTETVSGVPYFMNIPFIGYIFRNTIYSNTRTELMVIVTPHLVAPMPPGTELALPTDRGPFTFDDVKTQPDPAEVTRPRLPGILVQPNPFDPKDPNDPK